MAIHINDCTIAASSIALIDEFKAELKKSVEVTDLGELHWLLGIEIKRDRMYCTIHLSQRSYIKAILHQYSLEDVQPVSTLMDLNVHYSSMQSPATTKEIAEMQDVPYREAIGSLCT